MFRKLAIVVFWCLAIISEVPKHRLPAGSDTHWLVYANNDFCYTSQLKYDFRLEENMSRAMGQNSQTP